VRPGRAADHSPPSSAAVMKEYSYTSTHPLGHTGPVTGSLYLSPCYCVSHTKHNNVIRAKRRVSSDKPDGALTVIAVILTA